MLSAFFAGAEISMMSLNRYRLRYLVKQKNKQAIRVNNFLMRPDKLLSIVLIGNTLANIIAAMVATLIGHRLYGDLGVAIATIILTLIILVLAEMAPKTIAAMYPQEIAFICALPLQVCQWILAPIIFITSKTTNGILYLFNLSLDKIHKESLTGEELRSIVNEAASLLPTEHRTMLLSLLDLEQATVEDIMIPKAEIIGINIAQPWHEILDQLETTQHARLPIYKETIDNTLGFVHIRSVLSLALDEDLNIESLLKVIDPPYFIPEATKLNIQILNFQKMKKRSAFVVDEYGELLGLVTMEDLLEEIVGEFTTDLSDFTKSFTMQDDGFILIDATMTIRHLNRVLNWQLPLIGPRTLSGLIIEHLGYIPPPNCCLWLNNFQIEILNVGAHRIKTVRMLQIINKRIIK